VAAVDVVEGIGGGRLHAYLRLVITSPAQGSDPAVRIYEFRAFS
jgi:hypothetical protein